MSSPAFGATIELSPRASVRAVAVLFALHVAVLLLVFAALRPGGGMALIAGLVLLSWIFVRRHSVFGYGPNAIVRLTWDAEGRWSVHDRRGARWDAELLPSSLVHERLLVLNFRLQDGSRRTRALLGDELEPEALRRLRARLELARRQS
jgi:toxin CptA